MNWDELDGSTPVVGDPDAVNQVAAEFHRVSLDAELLVHRLGNLQAGTGDAIWRGPAADGFRELLDKGRPDLGKLVTSHDSAESAMRRYAVRLADAQDDADRALRDGGAAQADRDTATRDRDAFAGQAGTAGRTAAEADVAVQGVAARRLVSADPTYQAELLRYEATMRAQGDAARQQESAARAGQTQKQQAVDAAAGKLAAAKRLAQQAASLRDDAVHTVVHQLDEAAPAPVGRRGVLGRLWDGASKEIRRELHGVGDLLDRVTGAPEFMSWMNFLSDASDLLSTAATFMAFVPGLQEVAGGLLITAAVLKGVSFAGTLLAQQFGHASKGQVLGRGLDFGLSVLPMGKAAKLLSKTKGLRPDTLPGLVKRGLYYGEDLRTVKGYLHKVRAAKDLGKTELKYVTKYGAKVHVSPKQYFQLRSTAIVAKDLTKGTISAVTGTQHLVKDISNYGDPTARRSYSEVAPDAAAGALGEVVTQVGKATHHEGAATAVNVVLKPAAKEGVKWLDK